MTQAQDKAAGSGQQAVGFGWINELDEIKAGIDKAHATLRMCAGYLMGNGRQPTPDNIASAMDALRAANTAAMRLFRVIPDRGVIITITPTDNDAVRIATRFDGLPDFSQGDHMAAYMLLSHFLQPGDRCQPIGHDVDIPISDIWSICCECVDQVMLADANVCKGGGIVCDACWEEHCAKHERERGAAAQGGEA